MRRHNSLALQAGAVLWGAAVLLFLLWDLGESPMNDLAHEKLLLRDPFGAVIQLVNRQQKLY